MAMATGMVGWSAARLLLLYRDDDVVGRRLARSVYPRQVTPFSVTILSSLTVVPMFPPLSAARSTVTLPDFIFATISLVIMRGAALPGIAAVVMTMSTSSHCLASRIREDEAEAEDDFAEFVEAADMDI